MTQEGKFDLVAAKKLADEISAKLDSLPEGGKHTTLRAEVEELKVMLSGAKAASPAVEGKMKSVQGSLAAAAVELEADGIRAAIFLRDIGKMLGFD
jgi:hypothetical protein